MHENSFDTSRRLLATSGALTEAVLAFSDGGKRVRRFCGAPASQVAVSETGAVYVASTSPLGGRIAVHDVAGELRSIVCESAPGTEFTGVAVNARGNVLANKVHRGRGVIEEYTESGEPVRLYTVSGIGRAQLAID